MSGAAPEGPARGKWLHAVRRDAQSPPELDADDVVYTVERPESRSGKRDERRLRTRLHSAKILDGAGRFLCEAAIQDRSTRGMRLLVARNLGLPGRFAVHDDLSGEILMAGVVWRRERTLGVRLLRWASPPKLKPSAVWALRGQYYGIPD